MSHKFKKSEDLAGQIQVEFASFGSGLWKSTPANNRTGGAPAECGVEGLWRSQPAMYRKNKSRNSRLRKKQGVRKKWRKIQNKQTEAVQPNEAATTPEADQANEAVPTPEANQVSASDKFIPQRQELWDELSTYEPSDEPWCVIGDFNAILYKEDRMGGDEVRMAELLDLKSFVDTCELQEMRSIGPYYF
ncbi:hypothetical protein Cgig2_008477 [Carnegiea gigantea]|uniref:Uncharacterized protein n=1 Tax=Carnegiea gigantea TaxID=171969 RepID=A0A9Q1GT18_9CARY|nr:hypothetical protein Cgig2_008477 [Carnegiea gigantea]